MFKYSIFNIKEKNPLHPLDKVFITPNNEIILDIDGEYIFEKNNYDYIYRRNSFIKTDENVIYEYDLLKVYNKRDNICFTGVTSFKSGTFYLKFIFIGDKKMDNKICLNHLCNDDYEIINLGSILETKNAYKYIRNKFFFRQPDEVNKYALGINENIYLIKSNELINQSIKVNLSTDCYDKNGEMLFENDSLKVRIGDFEYSGLISNKAHSGFYFIHIDELERTLYLNNNLNKEKYHYVLKEMK